METVLNNIHALEAKAAVSNDGDKGYVSFAALISAYSKLEQVLNNVSVDQAKIGKDLVQAQNKQLDVEKAKLDQLLKLQEQYSEKVESAQKWDKAGKILGGIAMGLFPLAGAAIISALAAAASAGCKIVEESKYQLPASDITRNIGNVQGDVVAAKGHMGALQTESSYTKDQLGGTLSNLALISKQLNIASSAIGRSIGYSAQLARQAYNIKG